MENGIANAVGTTSGVVRNPRMMEGVGARVIRGPDWKWGKQVRLWFLFISKKIFKNCLFCIVRVFVMI